MKSLQTIVHASTSKRKAKRKAIYYANEEKSL
jgi:hypothetical protein